MPTEPDFKLHIRLQIRGQAGAVYGSGISQLLQRCESTRSLHKAATEMGMSYRKALAIVKRAEEGFGQPILEKTIGGVGGGGSQLTAFGRELVRQFHALEQEIAAFADQQLAARLPFVAGSASPKSTKDNNAPES